MNINLTDDRTIVGSYDNRSSGGVFLMPKERHMRGGGIQPAARECATVRQTGRSFPALFEVRLFFEKIGDHPARLCVKWSWSARAVHLLLRRSAKRRLIYLRRCQPYSAGSESSKARLEAPEVRLLDWKSAFFF